LVEIKKIKKISQRKITDVKCRKVNDHLLW